MSWRGFRFQTGEIDKVVKAIKEKGHTEMDIDQVYEVDTIIADLEKAGVKKADKAIDFGAIDTVNNPEFYGRVFFENDVYVDIFHVDEKEEEYDEIFWG